MIKDNYMTIKSRVTQAAINSKREPSSVHLIAVSKTKPVSMLMEAYDAGARDFGENKVQEILDKYDRMPKDIKWHMIGHLQTNKVKFIIDKVASIHSVDSLKLAVTISKAAVEKNIVMPVFIEVNVSNEDSKFGIKAEELNEFFNQIRQLPGLEVKGLMTVPPYVENPEDNRQYFVTLKQLAVDISKKNIDNKYDMDLSMGMSGDFEVAISEGATYVRVGTGIFGEREYII